MDFLPNHYLPLRHWHPHSETFSGGDSLLTALHNGWQLQGIFHQHYNLSGRLQSIYHMMLQQGSETAIMHVISNPFVERFIATVDCPTYLIRDTKQTPTLSQLQQIAS